MTGRSLEEIRALIDPEGYIEGMKDGRQTLIKRRALLFVDYDMTAGTPGMTEKQRAEILDDLERTIRDCQWRIEEIDRRIEAAWDGAMNRAARRRAKK